MPAQDPFAPLSRKKKIGYTVAAVVILGAAAALLGGMEGGFTAWQLLRVVCIVAIPALAILALIAWLSGGKRSDKGVGPANLKLPVRLLKTLPYMLAIVVLSYLVKALGLLEHR